MMAVTLRQLSASTSSMILIWGSVWGFPSIIERNVLFLNISLKNWALQIGLPPRDIDGPMKIQMASGFI
jgi:hypothetical protein